MGTMKTITETEFIQQYAVMTCPKCGRYMQRGRIDLITKHLFGTLRKWRCLSCGFSPSDPKEESK